MYSAYWLSNACVGSGAVGSNVLLVSVTTGFYNTLIGNETDIILQHQEHNTLIGYNAGSNLTTGGGSGNGKYCYWR